MKGKFDETKIEAINESAPEAESPTSIEAEFEQNVKEAKEEKAKEEKKPKIKKTPSMNIFQRMLAVENALAIVAKNLTVSTGNNKSYQAVSERDIIDAVKPLETEYGIYSYPYSRRVLESNLLENVKEYQGKSTKTTTFMTRIETVYRFVNVDNPDDYIETTVFSEGIDTQDKGSGKAMTYGDKYALMKMYKISTGDDPDANASEEVGYQKKNDNKKASSSSDGVGKSWGSGKTWGKAN